MKFHNCHHIDGRPILCSGYGRDESGNNNYQSACHIYNKESKQWNLHANLKTKRKLAGSVILEDESIWVTGGFLKDDSKGYITLASTEIVKLDGSVLVGQDLPVATDSHCMVKMHDGRVAILGGSVC